MRIFVGRKMTATAAQSRLLRSLVTSSGDDDFVFDVGAKCHGQLYSAIIVKVVSRELENVLVEQNHCHGLTTVSSSVVEAAADCAP